MIAAEKLKELPDNPGVYLMKNEDNKIIYVGKAKNLKNRVRQYFRNGTTHGIKVQSMVNNITDFEIIVTDTEMEALILEFNLIKKYLPRYNIMLKDDKSYPYIKVTLNEKFPRVLSTRNVKKDGAKYFGPYTNALAVKQTVEAINKSYPIKMCGKIFDGSNSRQRPCLNYFIHQCSGVCTGNVDLKKYWEDVNEIIDLLKGKDDLIIRRLTADMEAASKNLDFETAARLRDQIQGIRIIGEKQKIITSVQSEQDVISYTGEGNTYCVQVFNIREGKMLGRESYIIESDLDQSDMLNQFVKQFYSQRTIIPKEIIIPIEIEDREPVEIWLRERKGTKVAITVPVKGDKKKLLNMVEQNTSLSLFEHLNRKYNKVEAHRFCGDWLKEKLGLSKWPEKIESFDISNISGKDAVGSMAVFQDFKPLKKAYRRFRIKSVEGQNDYASTQEIIFRRIERALKEQSEGIENNFLPLPDIIMLDGGLGHISSVKKILDMYDLNIVLCGMVKNDKHKLEKLVTETEVIPIPQGTPIYYFLNELSEEVHRFAIEYHRKLRSDNLLVSELSNIPGIGKKRQKLLLEHYKSMDKIKEASVEELSSIEGIGRKNAETIHEYFSK